MNEEKIIYDSAIIGMGPGGLTAAIYLKRFNLKIVTFEKAKIGSKLYRTEEINNYPGLPGTGASLAESFAKQTTDNGIFPINALVNTIQKDDDIFRIQTEDGFYYAKTVIVAVGIREKEFKIPGAELFFNRGISRCAICDGPLFRKRPVAVYGHKNTAVTEAFYLSDISPHVYFIADRQIEADEDVLDELKNRSNVTMMLNSDIVKATGEKSLTALTVVNKETGTETEIAVSGLFLYVGSSANAAFLPFPQIFNERGYIKVDEGKSTAIPGLFAVGDVTVNPLKQVVVAAGDGANAALSVKQYLTKLK